MLTTLEKFILEILSNRSITEFINNSVLSQLDRSALDRLSLKDIKTYCDSNFKKIGKGSARTVYELNDKAVLKIANNKKGIAQNNTEISISNSQKYNDIISDIYEFSKKGTYIVSQKCKPLSDKEFNDITSLQLHGFLYYLRHNLTWDGPKNILFYKVSDMIRDFDLNRYDISDDTSWGIFDNRIVLVDYGMSNDIAKKMYNL